MTGSSFLWHRCCIPEYSVFRGAISFLWSDIWSALITGRSTEKLSTKNFRTFLIFFTYWNHFFAIKLSFLKTSIWLPQVYIELSHPYLYLLFRKCNWWLFLNFFRLLWPVIMEGVIEVMMKHLQRKRAFKEPLTSMKPVVQSLSIFGGSNFPSSTWIANLAYRW